MAGSCGARAIVLFAGGNLRALVVLASLGLAAQATLTGVLAPLRQLLQGFGQVQLDFGTLPAQLQATGMSDSLAVLLAAGPPVAVLLGFALRKGFLRRMPLDALAAVAVGLLVALGWWISAHVDVDPFDPAALTSLSFIAPVAETFLYLQVAVGRGMSLGPVVVCGTLVGAFAVALATGRYRQPATPLGFDCRWNPDGLWRRAGGRLFHRARAVRSVNLGIRQHSGMLRNCAGYFYRLEG